jgi:hypothetical protein
MMESELERFTEQSSQFMDTTSPYQKSLVGGVRKKANTLYSPGKKGPIVRERAESARSSMIDKSSTFKHSQTINSSIAGPVRVPLTGRSHTPNLIRNFTQATNQQIQEEEVVKDIFSGTDNTQDNPRLVSESDFSRREQRMAYEARKKEIYTKKNLTLESF